MSEDSNNSYQSSNQTPPSPMNGPPPVRKSDPQNTSIQNTSIQRTTTEPSAVAVSFEKDKISPLLVNVDITQSEKILLSKTFDDASIEHALKYISHPTTKIKKSLIRALYWACETKPEISKDNKEMEKEKQQQKDDLDDCALRRAEQAKQIRKEIVDSLASMKDPYAASRCEARPDFFRIENDHEQIKLRYDDNDFKNKVLGFLRKVGFPVPRLVFSLP